MLSVSSLVVSPGAAPFNLELAAGVVQVIEEAPPDLGRCLALLRRPQSGRIMFADQELTRLSDGALRKLRRRLQYIGGDPRRALLPHQTLAQVLDEPARIHLLNVETARERAATVATALRIPTVLLSRQVAALSTVLRWRALVARALTLDPELLIIDAPTPHVAPMLLGGLLADVSAARGAAALVWVRPSV